MDFLWPPNWAHFKSYQFTVKEKWKHFWDTKAGVPAIQKPPESPSATMEFHLRWQQWESGSVQLYSQFWSHYLCVCDLFIKNDFSFHFNFLICALRSWKFGVSIGQWWHIEDLRMQFWPKLWQKCAHIANVYEFVMDTSAVIKILYFVIVEAPDSY